MRSKTADSQEPLGRLEHRIARLRARAQQLESLSSKYWVARRVLLICGTLLALLSCKLAGSTTGLILTALFLAVFVLVAIYHNRVRDSITRNALMLNIKHVQIARIKVDWEHLSRSDQTPPDPGHPFEIDLDVTGERSLHRLLDSAVTKEGSRRLKSWLLSTRPDPLIIEKRQFLIRELSGLSLFRDKLHLQAAVASRDSQDLTKTKPAQLDQWDSRTLVAWIEHGDAQESLRSTVMLLGILAALNITLIVLALLDLVPHVWPIVFLIYAGLSIAKQGRTTSAWGEVQDLENVLRRFRVVFQYLESRRFGRLTYLAEVCAPFLNPRKRPSAELKRVERIAWGLGLRTIGPIWFLVNVTMPWDFFFAYRLEQLRNEISKLMPRWLDAWYELEALNSLANFAWLNPSYAFPELISNSTRFDARGIGHPLIKAEHKICNDLELDEQRRIVILTGSNMAGKSTFLRTVGANLCLAYAGAPVNA